ncbi:MAG: TIGR03757 family integrating conjugative element protein [Pseudomonas sp.]|nr:TIGR03757 family integrating conjugative element protein [Pseudomonas sp.]MBA4243687.1 TIGR03757 family integrating conjugative element protein [Pseudomonas sp.]UZZ09443.1 TIGR03757 family integrating conjugative element protein [Pseudomonas mendocina]UZZ09449.1 TIGR03757 family integrating conjugative element protein [Pseudomonas mendocina]
MPALLPCLPPRRKYPLATVLCTVLLGSQTQANDILVVTDSQNPVRATSDVQLIELDQPARIKAELGAHLPADPARSAALVQRRLKEGGNALQARLGTAYQGVVDAWSLGVTTIPAVIVDRRYVVYGEPDVAKAVALIKAHRRAQP